MTGASTAVAVVVPFYQRERGILPRSIRSVVRQHLPPGVRLKLVIHMRFDHEKSWLEKSTVAAGASPQDVLP